MLGLFLGALWLAVLKLWLQANLFLNSDTLAVAETWASLKAGGRLGEWSMGNHAYIFPDLALYQSASWMAPDLAGRQVAYGLLLGFLVWWVGSKLAARLFDIKDSAARACTAAGLMAGVAFLSAESGLGQWFFPACHGGALLASVWLSAWALKQREPSGWLAVLFVGVLSGLVHASDAVFATWALLPAFCLSLALGWSARVRIWVVMLISFGFKSFYLAYLKTQGMRLLHFRWGYFLDHARELLGQAWLETRQMPGGLALALGLSAGLALLLMSRWRREPVQAGFGLAWFAMLGIALSLVVLQGQFAGRYFSWCLWVPALLAPAYLASRWPAFSTWIVALPAAVGFLWLTLFRPPVPVDWPLQRQAAWLDTQLAQRGVTHGWSGYWFARPLHLLSQQGAQLIPVITDWGPDLVPFEWVSWRKTFAWDPELKQPQFVILNGLDKAKVQARFNMKPTLVEGEGLQVWFFEPAHKK